MRHRKKALLLTFLFVLIASIRTGVLFAQTNPSVDSIHWYRSAARSYSNHFLDTPIFYYQRERALLLTSSGQDADYATSCLRIGVLYARKRLYDSALSYLTECRYLREKLFKANSSAYLEALGAIAGVEYSMHHWEQSEALYRQARQILQSGGDTLTNTYAIICNGLLNLAKLRGEYEYAEQLALLTLRVRSAALKNPHHPSYAISLLQVGNIYEDIGQYSKAEPFFREVRQVWRDTAGVNSKDYIQSCVTLGQLYYLMGRLDSADSLYVEAQQLLEANNLDQSIDFASVCNNEANLYLSMNRYADAMTAEEKADSIWGELPDNDPNKPILKNTLGAACMGIGEYQRAMDLLTQAGELWKGQLGEENPYYAGNLRNLAQANRALGNWGRADSLYVVALRSKIAAAKRIFQFTSEQEQVNYLQSIAGTEDEYYSLLWETGAKAGDAFDIALADRNRILAASRHIRAVVSLSGNDHLQTLYNTWFRQKQILAGLYSSPNHIEQDQLQAAADSADQLEKDLGRGTESLSTMLEEPVADWKAVQGRLREGEAAIEWVSFHYFDGKRYSDSSYYMAFILRKDSPWPVVVRICEQRSLDSLLTRAGDHAEDLYTRGGVLRSNNSGGYSEQLYKLIWSPLLACLYGIHTVYLAPVGSLYRISFAAIPSGGDSVLSDRYRLEQLSSTADLEQKNMDALTAGDLVWLYGGVDYGTDSPGAGVAKYSDTWSSLPGTIGETDKIKRYGLEKGMKVKLLTGGLATEASIKSLNGLGYPTVLHLATHGYYIPQGVDSSNAFLRAQDPLMRSGLVFAGGNAGWNGRQPRGAEDGILTSYEVANLYLPAVRLVVLSACETALGDVQGNEGVYGLARAFRMAGVQNLVMSLWKVQDSASAEFMGIFYKGLFNGLDAQSAFLDAQTVMKNRYRSKPALWAAWIFVH